MTPQQQRIAIAEACGWKRWKLSEKDPEVRLEKPRDEKQLAYWISCGNVTTNDPITNPKLETLPDFLYDLNATNEAEKFIPDDLWPTYRERLIKAAFESCQKDHPEWKRFRTESCTAAQRAEAFLKTLGLWKDAD